MVIEEFYEAVGTDDFNLLVSRFGGNMALLERFVKKFPADLTFSQLQEAVEAKDYDAILMSAHTLKGLSANLGFTIAAAVSSRIVDAVRGNRYETIEADFDRLSEEYDRITGYIAKLD